MKSHWKPQELMKIFSSVAQSCPTLCDPWTAAHQASLSITNSRSLPKPMSIESVMPSNHLISVVPFSSCLQSFPASGSFQMSQFFLSGGRSTGVSASASVLPMNTQDWSPLGWTCWICLQSKGLSRVFSTPQFKSINSSALSFLYSPTFTSIHDYWKTIALIRWTFVGKVTSLLFTMLFRLVITFLPRSKRLHFTAAVIICSDFGAPPPRPPAK